MSGEQGGVRRGAEVCPIYRPGDRVMVELPSGIYDLTVVTSEIIDGKLWLYGAGPGSVKTFTAECVVRRLAPGEAFTWPES